MKVLFISNDPTIFDTASAARVRMHSYAALMDELHIVSVAGPGARDEQEGKLFLHPIRTWKVFRMRALAKRARALILKYEIDIVSAQDPFEHGLAALRAVCGTKAKLHVQVHTDFLSPWFVRCGNWFSLQLIMSILNRYRRHIACRVLKKADGIRVVSDRVKESIVKRYGARVAEPVVIPVAVDVITPDPVPLPKHNFTFSLIAVGRLESEKRIEDILAALKIVVRHYPMVGLFIVGEGRERARLEKIVRSLGLTGSVIFLGNRPDARGLMASAQAFIQASAYEGYGRTLIEAALARVPIITTDVGIVGEVLKNGEDVIAVPVAAPEALAGGITSLLKDNVERQRLKIHAEESVCAHLAAIGDLPKRIVADLESVRFRATLP